MSDHSLSITATRSVGPDGAIVIMIDTSFEPDGSTEGAPALRVLVNDDPVYEGVAYIYDEQERKAPDHVLEFAVSSLDYT